MQEISSCPLCGNNQINNYLALKDYFYSGDSFIVAKCLSCDFLFTNPKPSIKELQNYYNFENYISHSGVKKGLINKIYLLTRRFSIHSKSKIISTFKKGHRILDIGCGTGEFLKYFKERKWDTIGIEPNINAREYAVSHYGLEVKDDSEILKFEKESFDVITLWHVLEHIHSIHEQVSIFYDLLKKDGIMVVAIPNCLSFDAKYYREFWAAYDVPRHLYHFSRKTLSNLMNIYGFTVKKYYPMKLDAYYVSLLSEKYKHGKTHYIHGMLTAIYSNIYGRFKGREYSSLIFILEKKIV
jgi:2-polyprenyl-3-methyl-5-hydroxy-6-metoxy-1,4-benzoquinol methylase